MQAKIWNHSKWIKEVDPLILKKFFLKQLKKAGFEIINISEHYFKPNGYTCLFLLSESHFAIHTFPEQGKTYIQISSCNKEMYIKFLINT